MKTKPDDAPVGEAHAKAPQRAPGMTDAEMKSWIRREIHLAANGVSEEERETMNP